MYVIVLEHVLIDKVSHFMSIHSGWPPQWHQNSDPSPSIFLPEHDNGVSRTRKQQTVQGNYRHDVVAAYPNQTPKNRTCASSLVAVNNSAKNF
jgi:hypothetical protein